MITVDEKMYPRPAVRTAGRSCPRASLKKAPSGMGKISIAGVLRLRAPSAVSGDKSMTRSAQDDDFVGVLAKNISNKLPLMGRRPGLLSKTLSSCQPVPTGLNWERMVLTQTLKPIL
jgi:hypothetical protein